MNYQPEPPAGAWDGIAAALDNVSATPYSEKLFHFEQAPPPAAWSKIEAALDAEAPAKVVRMGRGRWIAAAAAVLILAFSATTFVMNRQSGSSSGTVSDRTAKSPIPTPVTTDTTTLDTEVTEQEETITQAPQVETGTTIAPSPGRSIATARPVKRRPVIAAAALGPALPRWEKAERRQPLQFSVPTDRYMVYSDGKSTPVKLSKKMFDVFSCAQEDLRCRERIQSLQQKIANAAMASDFTGMLDLLDHLRENQ
ncbi:MAG TPA: hypothetical protein VGB46_01950 [Flavisolibacter sp.]